MSIRRPDITPPQPTPGQLAYEAFRDYHRERMLEAPDLFRQTFSEWNDVLEVHQGAWEEAAKAARRVMRC